MLSLVVPSLIGGVCGALLLVLTPTEVFDRILPFLILFATILFMAQEPLQRRFNLAQAHEAQSHWLSWTMFFQLLVGLYGGYFGAGIGILMLAALSLMGHTDIHQMNAVKNVLGASINALAALLFIYNGLVVWQDAFVMDPGSVVMALANAVHQSFEYKTAATRVDSPIDEALASRKGVCQDFAHILIALLRRVGVPARYVSGYLFHSRGERAAEGATHAWVEAWLPALGWVGVDPTSNVLAGERHVRVAIGRDYADVAPTRGVYKGMAAGTLAVVVHVSRDDLPPASAKFSPVLTWTAPPPSPPSLQSDDQQQQ